MQAESQTPSTPLRQCSIGQDSSSGDNATTRSPAILDTSSSDDEPTTHTSNIQRPSLHTSDDSSNDDASSKSVPRAIARDVTKLTKRGNPQISVRMTQHIDDSDSSEDDASTRSDHETSRRDKQHRRKRSKTYVVRRTYSSGSDDSDSDDDDASSKSPPVVTSRDDASAKAAAVPSDLGIESRSKVVAFEYEVSDNYESSEESDDADSTNNKPSKVTTVTFRAICFEVFLFIFVCLSEVLMFISSVQRWFIFSVFYLIYSFTHSSIRSFLHACLPASDSPIICPQRPSKTWSFKTLPKIREDAELLNINEFLESGLVYTEVS